MTSYSASRQIAFEPEEVFAFLADGQRHSEWMAAESPDAPDPLPETLSTEHVSGPGVGPGATYRLREALGSHETRDQRFSTEVYERPGRLVFHSSGPYDTEFRLEARGGDTLLTEVRHQRDAPGGFTGWLYGRLARRYAAPAIAGDLKRIEGALETQRTNSA